ncbi:estrogen sulfotransferase-like [Sitophilus oryzae]|uniref:Estrogen sulfotransferase-like n=1 Tax=Sitophilus oryzae TaxID=7048 RepID=A0A6J2XK15_SITOR|nr:estrogen sulfotransferase-like [Sitophilus oryzae]XP_030751842.1 estrogen sulfotransferase-like [Sitophilus oryzae]XP_030751843.1 estrogen sulfotransferase-like [Sitophilus oryzae]
MNLKMPLYVGREIYDRTIQTLSNEKVDDAEKRIPFPYEIRNLEAELNSQILKDFAGERTGYVQVSNEKWFFPSGYAKEAENIYNFKLRKDDVFVITFPRSGTTWTQEMVWLLCNNLDYEKASKKPLMDRFPFLEYNCFVHEDIKQELLNKNRHDPTLYQMVEELDYPAWKLLSQWRGRRFIKTHLPFSLLPPNLTKEGCKVIYVARNPKDVAVSFYYLNRTMITQGYHGDFPKYWDYFERNLQPWTPYWSHLKEGWGHRHDPNVLFIFYEDMNKNSRTSIEKIAQFLEKSYSAAEFDTLENHLKFSNFKNNKSVNFDNLEQIGVCLKSEQSFVRKGENNGWKECFEEELEKRADKWIEDNMKDTDLKFPS